MTTYMYQAIFQKAGLTLTQALILDYLYQNKQGKASEIAKNIKKSRAIVYKDLDEMVGLNIIERIDKANQVTFFRLGHPSYIEKFFDKKAEKIKKDRLIFDNYLPDMISAYNLFQNKPGVRFYEGLDGVQKTLDDMLKSRTEILAFIDVETLRKNSQEQDQSHVKKRLAAKINKKIIAPLSAKEYYQAGDSELTQIRFLKNEVNPFRASIQIYDNKISYQIAGEESAIGVIIEDKNIYEMHKIYFEYIWNSL